MPVTGRQARGHLGEDWFAPAVIQAASTSFDSGFVLLDNAGGDASPGADRDAVCFAHARMSPLRSRLAEVRADRRRCPRPALRAWSTKGASCLRNALAFFLFRSISYSEPPSANPTVSSAGPPPRSSSSATVIFVAIVISMSARALCTVQIKCHAAATATPPLASLPDGCTRQAATGCSPCVRSLPGDDRSSGIPTAAKMQGPANGNTGLMAP